MSARYRTAATVLATAAALLTSPAMAHASVATAPTKATTGVPTKAPDPNVVTNPDHALGANWRTSTDVAVTADGDAEGFHLMVADRKAAYKWRTAATLREPAFETDQWIGQFCVTGSGQRAVVVYAPREFSNHELTMQAGGFVAVVNLVTGAVIKSADRVALAYYNPTCGAGETASVSRLEGHGAAQPNTVLAVIDARTGTDSTTIRANGQYGGAVPVGDTLITSRGTSIVELSSKGKAKVVATAKRSPFRMLADGANDVAFQYVDGGSTTFARLAGGKITTSGSAKTGTVKLRSGAGGRVFAVGPNAASDLNSGWRTINASADSDISTEGGLAVTAVTGRQAPANQPATPSTINAVVPGGTSLQFSHTAMVGTAGGEASPAAPIGPATATAPLRGAQSLGSPTDPVDDDATCAVPRNDPTIQAYQPTPQQVEWAVDNAVANRLTFNRPANWNNDGLPAFSPQGLFPPGQLNGGGSVPAQVLLGILAQESNQKQASWHVVDASGGNPLTSLGYYGIDPTNPDFGTIDFTNADTVDCGYGIGQVTTGMSKIATPAMTELRQKAVAIDYATNISASLQLLIQKWNETRAAGLIANDGSSSKIENWFFAVWAYNSGFHPQQADPNAPWGVGWLNNPVNPIYEADRAPFLSDTRFDDDPYDNSKRPSKWSYPERVMGWAYVSQHLYDYANDSWGSTYLGAYSPYGYTLAQPDLKTFCVANINHCDADQQGGPCLNADLTQCWWHNAITWINCTEYCGHQEIEYGSVDPRPFADTIHPSQCEVQGIPDVPIIDDIDTAVALGPGGCDRTWTKGGDFSLSFSSATNAAGATIYPSKVDFHQISAGFGGHFWFAKTVPLYSPLTVTGRWTPTDRYDGWVRVMVHLPDHGDWTQQAQYVIRTGDGGSHTRFLPTEREANTWVSLGAFEFDPAGAQSLELSNVAADGIGVDDIAWDAAAFVPLPAKPMIVAMVGDSYGSGEGVGGYYRETDIGYGTQGWNACRRSESSWARLTALPGMNETIGQLTDDGDPGLEFASVACSGSYVSDMVNTASTPGYWHSPEDLSGLDTDAEGQFHEYNQLESGVLSSDTDLVLVSGGGNDAHFSDVVEDCVRNSCSGNEAAAMADIDNVESRLVSLLQHIRAKALNARIVLVGYPHIIASDHALVCEESPWTLLTGSEMDMLNRLADHMTTMQDQAVEQTHDLKINFLPRANIGSGLCASSTSNYPDSPIRGVTIVGGQSVGDGEFHITNGHTPEACAGVWNTIGGCLSRSSFHPNILGANEYAVDVTNYLATLL